MQRRISVPEAAERPQDSLTRSPTLRSKTRGIQVVVFVDNAAGQFKDCRRGNGAYGGLWTENVVSGIARRSVADAMLRVESAAAIRSCCTCTTSSCVKFLTASAAPKKFTHLMTAQSGRAPEAADRGFGLDR